ncbi:MAG: hypothetical protein HYZ34_12675 [Ignavibacteriae bacterium]|nr:hypothetical protein [Ignavibacteriota bacterium]
MSTQNDATPPARDETGDQSAKLQLSFLESIASGLNKMGKSGDDMLKELRSGGRIAERNLTTTKVGIAVMIIGLVVAITSVLVAIRTLDVTYKSLNQKVVEVGERVEKNILARQFRIVDPADGTLVDIIYSIRGKSPFPNMKNYIIVTPMTQGIDMVQHGPLSVSPSGLWTGKAIFGQGAVGEGESFLVRCLATDSTLTEGPLTTIPSDAIFSESITVIR